MKFLYTILLALGFSLPAVTAADTPAAKPYPLEICIISGEKLGEMGKPVEIVKDGQQVKFCCKPCIKRFEKDPAKYLKEISEQTKK